MPLRKPASTIAALKVLVQGRDDAPGLDFALDLATSVAGGRRIAVVSAGQELSGLAREYQFDELVGANGLPTRSLAEIGEEIEDLPADVGVLVVLDTAQVYRATRCSTRRAEERRELSPGLWDEIAESAMGVLERAHRRGIHQIWCAPSSETRTLNDDGDVVVTGRFSAKSWGDLPRSVHVWVDVDGDRIAVRRDSTRLLADRISGACEMVRAIAPVLGGDPRPSVATLDESTEAELGARQRRTASVCERFTALAHSRVWQGPQAVEALRSEWAAVRDQVTHDSAAVVDRVLETASNHACSAWAPMRAVVYTDERSSYDGAEAVGVRLHGPSPTCCPSSGDGLDVRSALMRHGPGYQGAYAFASVVDDDDLPGWIAAFSRFVGVWSRVPFAVICANVVDAEAAASGFGPKSPVPKLGHKWSDYAVSDLRNVLAHVYVCAAIEAKYDQRLVVDQAKVASALAELARFTDAARRTAERLGIDAFDDDPPDVPDPGWPTARDVERAIPYGLSMEETASAVAVLSSETAHTESSKPVAPSIDLPSVDTFGLLSPGDAAAYLNALITSGGWWPSIDGLHDLVGTAPGQPKRISSWTRDERAKIYEFLLEQRRRLAS